MVAPRRRLDKVDRASAVLIVVHPRNSVEEVAAAA
jgi:hypothetical protein